ncbi:protein phosphatase methylesterase 1 [Pyricularia oryzae 70-15]|uniref:Protein phosphatase methylesterase 1 n=1 Tax=Pyricularia oryzae (strain 70-15 / ATCC MYA-4617 / FGSC 8958) TaxID=242507 RepID=G4MUD9_PYRO7|nr:protein phosphatase methylesterase 1 [Pyricularia oryzae 70-15]EHA54826.1 protein phosphatase methylesterase 1 [Pyricularia oryzae 70-15]
MSELQKRWAKARVDPMASTPQFDEADEQQAPTYQTQQQPKDYLEETGTVPELPELPEDDSSSASSASSTGTIVPSVQQNLFARPQGLSRGRTLEPVPWTTYFERELFLEVETEGSRATNTFHAYLTSPVGKGPLFVTHHGAGSSGLSFAIVGAEVRKLNPSAGILSLDARGHGSTTTSSPGVDLSLETLAADLLGVIHATKDKMGWQALPPMVLVGHSLGGAVVTHLAGLRRLDDSVLLGYAVLDVVEGSAMDALQSMQTYLSTRPTGFASVPAAIDWHVRSRTIRNSVSARTSVPALLTHCTDGADEGAGGGNSRPWRWRTDLAATQPFWEGWFVGLSKKFLTGRGGKMLLVAGTDRLDTELTIGQMQGKYALQVFPEAGHFIHEDLPEKTAIALVDFHRRNDRSVMVLPPKVADLIAQGKRV